MNKQQAERLVDRWAMDWRTYLDGKLHRLPRQALIDAIVNATAVSDDDASEDLEGKDVRPPMTEAELRKAVVRQVHREEVAKREKATAKADEAPHEADDDVAADEDQVQAAAAVLPDKPDDLADGAAAAALAAADALTLLQDVAREDRRPLILTPFQVDRFNRFGLLATVKYVVDEPMPVETVPVEQKRKRGRPPGRR